MLGCCLCLGGGGGGDTTTPATGRLAEARGLHVLVSCSWLSRQSRSLTAGILSQIVTYIKPLHGLIVGTAVLLGSVHSRRDPAGGHEGEGSQRPPWWSQTDSMAGGQGQLIDVSDRTSEFDRVTALVYDRCRLGIVKRVVRVRRVENMMLYRRWCQYQARLRAGRPWGQGAAIRVLFHGCRFGTEPDFLSMATRGPRVEESDPKNYFGRGIYSATTTE